MGKPGVAIELSSAERRELKSLARRRKTAQGFLSREIRDSLGDDDDGFYLYRHMLHPNVTLR